MRNVQQMYAPVQQQYTQNPHPMSPIKANYPRIPLEFSHLDVIPAITLPESTPIFTDSPSKRMSLPSSQSLMPAHTLPSQPSFAAWHPNMQHFDQENYNMQLQISDNYIDFPVQHQMQRGPLKRSYSETVPYSDKPFKKGRMVGFSDEQEEIVELPAPEDMPIIMDPGDKPPYSYAQMIGMSILRAPGRRLTLASIYEWISTTFRYYREESKAGWHNSIRHNLSLNKAFIKQERPKSDAGKGCYWAIKAGSEAQFFKEKPRKNNASMSIPMQQSFITQPTSQEMSQQLSEAIQPQPWLLQSQISATPQMPLQRSRTAPMIDTTLPELDSDATLPASDPALNDEEIVLGNSIPQLAPPSMAPPPSSPPLINSSPPVMPRHHARTISSPANITRASSKRATLTGMDDSGYFSSLESSARRPRHGGLMPTSELGFNPTRKVGRAEEEIVRMRSSSRDITPGRRLRQKNVEQLRSSSPSPVEESPVDPPMTPSVVFKKPALPPQSISPNTQLKRHREAMSQFIGGSPGKQLDHFNVESDMYSPAFKIATPGLSHSFDDSFLYDFIHPGTPVLSSPLKPTRKALQRAHTSANILTEGTKKTNAITKINGKTPTKIPGKIVFKAPSNPSYYGGSPLKKAASLRAIDLYNDENENSLFDFECFADENSEGEELDISKGFSKIGSTKATTSSLNFGKVVNGGRAALKPALARSNSTRF